MFVYRVSTKKKKENVLYTSPGVTYTKVAESICIELRKWIVKIV